MEACIRVLRLLGSCQRHYLLKGNLGELHRDRPVCSLERVTMTLIHLKAKRLHQYRADDLELAFMSILLQRHPSHQTRCGVAVNMLSDALTVESHAPPKGSVVARRPSGRLHDDVLDSWNVPLGMVDGCEQLSHEVSPRDVRNFPDVSQTYCLTRAKPPTTQRSSPGDERHVTNSASASKQMELILHVAEKPSLAAAIATFLAHERAVSVRHGETDVHELDGSFLGKPARFRVTSVKGHVFNLDFTEPHSSSWDRPPIELFSCGTVKTPTSGAVCNHLREAAKGCSHLVLWLDCDREGENICFEVMHVVLPALRPAVGDARRVWRARFSAVSAASVTRAMETLTQPNEAEASAVDARQELDLKVGVAFTRYLTQSVSDRIKRLANTTISFGPCQTPALGFVVQRHLEIAAFVPEPYWTLAARLQVLSADER